MRTAIGGFMCAIGAFGVSCSGDSCTGPTYNGEQPQLTLDLASAYIFSYLATSTGVSTGYPYQYGDSAGLKLRVWSDTLRLNATDKSYTERGRVGQLNPTTGDELIKNYALAGVNTYTLDATGNPVLPKFLGGSGTATREAGYQYASLRINTGGLTWYFSPKYP